MNNTLDTPKKIDELLDPGMTLMVATTAPGGAIESHPLTAAKVDGDVISILFDSTAEWAPSLRNGERLHVTVSDNRQNVWMTLDGTLAISTDAKLIDDLWNPIAGAYFDDGRESAGIAVLLIDVDRGIYWTTPSGRVGALVSMIKAKFGDPGESGEHGKVKVD